MNFLSQRAMHAWLRLGTRFLPFADAATLDLPLSRLLRLSLFQVSVGMALVLLIGTLNRVMIVELGVPASLVGVMISLPLLFAPFRALIGFKSDTHRSELGWRRVPFMYRGAMLTVNAASPRAVLESAGATLTTKPGVLPCSLAATGGAACSTAAAFGFALPFQYAENHVVLLSTA